VREKYILRPVLLALLLLVALAFPNSASSVELWAAEEGVQRVDLDTAMKGSGLAAFNPDSPLLYPNDWDRTGLLRLRLMFHATISDTVRAELAYEHRANWTSSAGGAALGGAILPSFSKAPWRIEQLDWQILRDGDKLHWRQEIDRALLSYQPTWGSVNLGRQAIGLGRGVIFSAVDLFSPFTPTEADREWRRGVDALRAEYRLTDTTAIEGIAVAGRSWADSAVLGRFRGYYGNLDAELLAGKRARDAFIGLSLSGIVGEGEMHGELALFRTPDPHPDGSILGNDRLIPKAVLGGSYTFNVGNGLTILGEYHYSGFGIKRAEDATRQLLFNPDWRDRYMRGDSQILTRHAFATQTLYPLNEAWSLGLLSLVNPRDGSGLVAPFANWDFSQHGSLRLFAYCPWGKEPGLIRLRSEYGSVPLSFFAQVALYF
jgi:hypothetical protein